MNLLELFFILSGVIIFVSALDIARKEKFNALHFLVFLSVWIGLMVFTLFPDFLSFLWDVFWLQRGADLLVYVSLIFIFYFVLLLLRKLESNKRDLTELVREIALQKNQEYYLTPEQEEIFIIPAFNEAKVILNTLQTVIDAGYKNIIVINDGSIDNSQQILGSISDKIIILHHFKNRWQWAALETGFEYVRRFANEKSNIITFDSDGQHNINDVKKFTEYAKKFQNIEIFLGSRFLRESTTNISLKKKIFLKLAIVFTYFLSQIRLSDTHNGFRFMRKSALEKIKISIDGMWHASEIIDIISQKKIPHMEVPVDIIYTEYSLSKGQKMSNSINIVVRLVWSKFFR